MKVEIPIENPENEQEKMFNKHIGEDVIYFHTRCWGSEDDSRSNYMSCGGKEREEQHKDKFIESINEEFDPTYRDHYFKAVQNEEYDKIIKAFTHAKENKEWKTNSSESEIQ